MYSRIFPRSYRCRKAAGDEAKWAIEGRGREILGSPNELCSLIYAMLRPASLCLLAICSFLGGCATRPLPPFEKPLARAPVQAVRTTAYTDTESDHRPYGCHNALGTSLCAGQVNSAAADWSRWPAGTVFRIRETGEVFQVDDYGWALSGTNTIDLYKPSRSAMNAWGVHHVNIEIMQWGDVWHSYGVLKSRDGYAHVRRMLKEIEDRYPHDASRIEAPIAASAPPAPAAPAPAAPAPPKVPVQVAATDANRWPKAQAAVIPTAPPSPRPAVASNPFFR